MFHYSVPTASIGGELDGLARVTRFAEAFYTQITDSSNVENAMLFPVTVVEGVSHMQFASGSIPQHVLDYDLIPDVEDDMAHKIIAADMNTFMLTLTPHAKQVNASKATLRRRLHETFAFIKPIISALKLEGYHNFRPPCLCKQVVCKPQSTCTAGCPYSSEVSQKIMGEGGLKGLLIENFDSFHNISESQPDAYLPAVNNTCDHRVEGGCTLYMNSVTQGVYHMEGDTGLFPISAIELRSKLVSRQNSWTHAGVKNVSFKDADGNGLRCGEINQRAIDWAKSNAGHKTFDRFYIKAKGQPYSIAKDKNACQTVSHWISQGLHYNKTEDKKSIVLTSPQFSATIDFEFKVLAGAHYCKLLSPGRAMEWLYVDGLRQFNSLKA